MSFEYRVHERCACGSVLSSQAWTERAADASNFLLRGTQRVYERPRPFRIEHIALDLELDHGLKGLRGSAELTIERVDGDATSLRLDALAFTIDAVHLKLLAVDGKTKRKGAFRAAAYVYDDESLDVTIPAGVTRAVLRVRYAATPRRGMYFMEPDDHVKERPRQIWTQCQDEDARHIFPCHDKPHIKQTMDIQVAVEPGWFVLSNGDLVSSRAAQKKGSFHYRMRDALPSYLFTIVAGEFDKVSDKIGKLPVDYYVPPGRKDDGKRTFANTPAMIRYFAKVTGVDYPWSKYAQVVVSDFIFGGMENTGATTMYEHILLDERASIDVSSDDLIAHELAHQWFGDFVTCRDWSHAWLNEGFATYFEHVWRQHHLGQDEYEQGLRVDQRAYLGEANGRYQRPVVCQDYEVPIDIFDRHLYEKGALFLHSLRLQLGEEDFWRGVNLYLTSHARSVVETRDLLRAMEDVSGQSLEQFFEQALYRAAYPKLDVVVAYEEGLLSVTVKQTLANGVAPFVLDLELDIAESGKRQMRRETRRLDKASETFAVAVSDRPRFVVVDPRLRIVGRVGVTAPADMLRRQLVEAETSRGRMLAAESLGQRDDPKTIEALASALRSTRVFWGVRAAAAHALGNIRSEAAYDVLSRAARTRQPKVRRAVATALGRFKSKESAKLLTRLAEGDESVLVASAAGRALGATRRPEAYQTLVGLLDQPSWAEVIRAGAIGGLAELRDERAVDVLKERTKYGEPTRARRAAIAAISAISTGRKTREHLEELLEDHDPHLRVTVADALGELGDIKARGALRRQLERDLDGRVRRRIREVLRDLGGRSRRDMRALREEVEELRKQQGELKARMSKLEARLSGSKAPRKHDRK